MADIKGHLPARMAVKVHHAALEIVIDTGTHSAEDSKYFEFSPARFEEKSMGNTQRRAIGLLVVLATLLTVMAVWNLPDMAATERAV